MFPLAVLTPTGNRIQKGSKADKEEEKEEKV
jgi:hypothetical protein